MATATKPTRFQELAAQGAAWFEQVKEHAKLSAQESAALMDAAACHVRSAAPQALALAAQPTTAIRAQIGDGVYDLSCDEGELIMHIVDGPKDAALMFRTRAEAEGFVRDFVSVMGGCRG